MVKNDLWIKKMSLEKKMIVPFSEKQIKKTISYGLSSYGYDIKLAEEFKIFKNLKNNFIDPKKISLNSFAEFKGRSCLIPPNSFILGRSWEYFKIPRKIICLCFGKSTYARCGINVNITPLEPEWEGYITIQITNASPYPVKVYAKEGIAQVVFLESEEECLISYKDKKGKYQRQKAITLAKI